MLNKRSWQNRIASGLRLAGWTVLGILTCVLLVGGAAAAFSVIPNKRALGWTCVVVASIILAYTVKRWAKVLPGVLLLATVNALVMLKTGTLVNNPSVRVPRQVALGATLLLAASCLLSLQFRHRRVGPVDRIALLSYVACTVWGMVTDFMLVPLMLGTVVLFLAWVNNRIRRGRVSA